MKKFLLLVLIAFSCKAAGFAQDKIITLNDDTINCKITRISHEIIYFEVFNGGIRSSGQVQFEKVKDFIQSHETLFDNYTPDKIRIPGRFNLSLGGGLGYLVSSSTKAEESMTSIGFTSAQAESYYRKLKTGISGNAAFTYFLNSRLGAGISYRVFSTNALMKGQITDGTTIFYATYQEKIYVNYIGPSFVYCQPLDRQGAFRLNYSYSAGMAFYRDEAGFLMENFLLQGKSIAFNAVIGTEYFLSERFSIGADLSAFYSVIRKMNYTDRQGSRTIDLEKEQYENLSRVEISFGIRLYL